MTDPVHGVETLGSPAPPSASAPAPPPFPEFLTVAELAALLRMSRNTVYDAFAAGEIPGGRRVRGVIRFRRDIVLDWFRSQGSGPASSRRGKG